MYRLALVLSSPSEIQTEFSYAFLKEHLLIVWPTGKDSTNKVPSDKLHRQTRDCDGAPVGLPSLSPPSGSLDQHLSLPAGAAILTLSSLLPAHSRTPRACWTPSHCTERGVAAALTAECALLTLQSISLHAAPSVLKRKLSSDSPQSTPLSQSSPGWSQSWETAPQLRQQPQRAPSLLSDPTACPAANPAHLVFKTHLDPNHICPPPSTQWSGHPELLMGPPPALSPHSSSPHHRPTLPFYIYLRG